MRGNNILYGALLLTIASASWGAMFPVAAAIFETVSPFYFTLLRYLPVALILTVMLYLKEGRSAFSVKGAHVSLWFFGVMAFTVYNLLIFIGQDQLGASGILLASVMEAAAPIISIVVMWAIFKKRPALFTLLTIIAAFFGVLLVVTNGDFSLLLEGDRLLPLFYLFLAALGWALYTIGGSRFPSWSVLRYSTLTILYGMATTTVFVMIGTLLGMIEAPTLTEIYNIRYHMLFMILFPGLFALLGWNKGVQILTPINAILFINFAPVTTIIIRMIQGYTIQPLELIGVAIVCAMIIANNLYQRVVGRKEVKERTEEAINNYLEEHPTDRRVKKRKIKKVENHPFNRELKSSHS